MSTALSRRPSPGQLIDRILEAPHLAHVVPRLQPEILQRVIQHCGLEDCGQLVSLITPGQLARVFDLDLWRPAAPGRDEQFDGDRFGLWLEVMVEADVSRAAAVLAAMDSDLVAAGFVQHVRVFDSGAVGLIGRDQRGQFIVNCFQALRHPHVGRGANDPVVNSLERTIIKIANQPVANDGCSGVNSQ